MDKRLAWVILILLAAIVFLLVLLLRCCQRARAPEVVVRDPAVEVMAEGAECPHAPTDRIPLSGPITAIPEYHDCQRFIVKDANGNEVYDSLYAIFASFTLARISDTIDGNNTANTTIAIPGATIRSYGGTYSTLHIAPGFNCVYFWRSGATWRAWMVNNGTQPVCASTLDASRGTLHELNVVVTHPGGFTQDGDYPPVARWEWDAGESEQYIGIKCGVAWCEVSDDGQATPAPVLGSVAFAPPPAPTVAAPTSPGRVNVIKGWHDAQRLASWQNGKAVPTDIWATVIPHPDLNAMRTNLAFDGNWAQVATIVASDDYDGAVLKLTAGSQNTIWLCHGSADDCDVPQQQLCEADRATVRWWGKSEHGAGSNARVEYRCVLNVTHPPPPDVPATARWRWLAHDETTWTRCDDGCCKLQ